MLCLLYKKGPFKGAIVCVMYNWDYNLPKNWKPQTRDEWVWYLERKINIV